MTPTPKIIDFTPISLSDIDWPIRDDWDHYGFALRIKIGSKIYSKIISIHPEEYDK